MDLSMDEDVVSMSDLICQIDEGTVSEQLEAVQMIYGLLDEGLTFCDRSIVKISVRALERTNNCRLKVMLIELITELYITRMVDIRDITEGTPVFFTCISCECMTNITLNLFTFIAKYSYCSILQEDGLLCLLKLIDISNNDSSTMILDIVMLCCKQSKPDDYGLMKNSIHYMFKLLDNKDVHIYTRIADVLDQAVSNLTSHELQDLSNFKFARYAIDLILRVNPFSDYELPNHIFKILSLIPFESEDLIELGLSLAIQETLVIPEKFKGRTELTTEDSQILTLALQLIKNKIPTLPESEYTDDISFICDLEMDEYENSLDSVTEKRMIHFATELVPVTLAICNLNSFFYDLSSQYTLLKVVHYANISVHNDSLIRDLAKCTVELMDSSDIKLNILGFLMATHVFHKGPCHTNLILYKEHVFTHIKRLGTCKQQDKHPQSDLSLTLHKLAKTFYKENWDSTNQLLSPAFKRLCASASLFEEQTNTDQALNDFSETLTKESVLAEDIKFSEIFDCFLDYLLPMPTWDEGLNESDMEVRYDRLRTFTRVFLKLPQDAHLQPGLLKITEEMKVSFIAMLTHLQAALNPLLSTTEELEKDMTIINVTCYKRGDLHLSRTAYIDATLSLPSSHESFQTDSRMRLLRLLTIMNAVNRYWAVLFENLQRKPIVESSYFCNASVADLSRRVIRKVQASRTGDVPEWFMNNIKR